MAAEEEVAAEVEAVQAVYGDDCVLFDSFPPHLHLHIKPRTADVTSEQVFFFFFIPIQNYLFGCLENLGKNEQK